MFITVICWDTHTMESRLFHAPRSQRSSAETWVQTHLVDEFINEGLELELAEDRARDFEVLYVFEGKQHPIH